MMAAIFSTSEALGSWHTDKAFIMIRGILYNNFIKLVKHVRCPINPLIVMAGRLLSVKISTTPSVTFIYLHRAGLEHMKSFRRLLEKLQADGYAFISTDQAEKICGSPLGADRRFLHLSFDDGHADNMMAAELLKELNIPATFFVTTELVDGRMEKVSPFLRLEIAGRPTISWAELKLLRAMGFEIGSHAATHRRFSELDQKTAREELRLSKERIEDKIGEQVLSFSFPFGRQTDFLDRDIDLARSVEYRYLFSTELSIYRQVNLDQIVIGRYGVEPFLSAKAVQYLINGLLERLR